MLPPLRTDRMGACACVANTPSGRNELSIFVFASVVPLAGHEALVEQALRDAAAQSRLEPGCERYDLFRAVQGEVSFQLFEAYADQAALSAHAQSAHFLALKEKIGQRLAKPLGIQVSTGVDIAA
ncbi:MAG: antibiotic biosynthesis monooxygenase [Proteobacteria bacterium]|nr:antibiotic biosynthesis monooxygenase [Pseudomonadota bacterium]